MTSCVPRLPSLSGSSSSAMSNGTPRDSHSARKPCKVRSASPYQTASVKKTRPIGAGSEVLHSLQAKADHAARRYTWRRKCHIYCVLLFTVKLQSGLVSPRFSMQCLFEERVPILEGFDEGRDCILPHHVVRRHCLEPLQSQNHACP